jgi:hypothetical protein
LGDNTYGQTNVPPGLANLGAVAAGYQNLAVTADGAVVAWPTNEYTWLPAGLTNVAAVSVSSGNHVALKKDGTVVAWGSYCISEDVYFDLSSVPPGLANVGGIAAGASHSLAVVGDGSPLLVRQPVAQTVYSGETVTLESLATGAEPLSYQWRRNGVDIRGDGFEAHTLRRTA